MAAIVEAKPAVVRHVTAANRLRLEIDALLRNPELARRIEASVAQRPGVARVTANPRSGRVLIELVPGASMPVELVTRAMPRPRRARKRRVDVADAHAREAGVVLAMLGSSTDGGITDAEAERRLDSYGPNLITEEAPPSRLAVFARQLTNVPTALLLGSATISMLLGDLIDASAIVLVIGLNAAIGYRIERRSDELLASWREAEVGHAEVIRDGRLETVQASELVPGDVLVVRGGNVIPADARVIDAHRLSTDEAALTGESEPVGKTVDAVGKTAALGDRTSMIYRGTTIASGHGRAVVVATGAHTELANVQRMASASRGPKARLQQRLNALASRLAWSSIAASGISAVASLLWRRPPVEVLRDTVALGVAALPEGMPVTSTAALVTAMGRMRERGIVVRRLGIAETLGGVTVACADKTGTLTENRMRLEVVWIGGRRIAFRDLRGSTGPVASLVAASVLNSDLDYHQNGGTLAVAGSSTEQALAHAAEELGIDPVALFERFPRRRLTERTEEAKYVITEHHRNGTLIEIVKGAPEQVVELCEVADADAVLAENAALAREGLRVLAVASRGKGEAWTFLGLVGLRDPLREGAADAVRSAARAGIRTVMLTGDQRGTAEAIARLAGLDGEVIEGTDLPAILDSPDAGERLRRIAVVARVSPADKLAVVDALRAAGEVVAMAGDGINDAPALKAADVGIAVGVRSTDLARQTADVVLEHEDLRSILAAVAEGRIVQDNLRRAIRFQVAGNLGELLLVVAGSFVGRRLFTPLGLLWINMLTDTLPGLALALEPGDPSVLDRPPAHPGAPMLDRDDWIRVLRDGSVIAAGSGAATLIGGPLAGFASIGASQFGYAAACRAPEAGPPSTQFMAMVGGSAALHAIAVGAAPMRGLLGITGMPSTALATFVVALAAPLYLAWKHEAGRELVRTNKETSR